MEMSTLQRQYFKPKHPSEPTNTQIALGLLDWLKERWSEGDTIEYEAIEQRLRMKRTDSRFRAIVQIARKKFHQAHGLYFGTERTVGLKCLSGIEQLGAGTDTVRLATRRIGQGGRIIASIGDDRLDTNGRAKRDFNLMRLNHLRQIAMTESRAMKLEVGKVKSHPKLEKA